MRDVEHFADILETLDAIVWEADALTLEFTYVSKGAERILGFRPDQWIGKPGFWESLIHPDDRKRTVAFCRSAIEHCNDHQFEYRAIAADGREVWLHDIVRIVVDNDGMPRLLRGVMTDITDRIEAQQQLLQSQKMDAIGRLAGGLAHDFNNILAAIMNYAAFIRDEPHDAHAVAADATEIVAAGERAAALTRQLLVFSRRETPHAEPLDLREVITEHSKMLRRMIGESIELHLDLSRGPTVVADRIQMEQVLLNLAVNARDAMPQGGPLSISLDQHDGCVRLRVRDAGVGMSESVRARAFEPFFTTKESSRGTGLGLSTVYGIVKELGGSIALHSVEGEGTNVEILLPPARGLVRSDPDKEVSSPWAVADSSVLLVEDAEQVREIVHRMLVREGHRVVVAADARDALRMADEGEVRPDVVVTDVVMPGMSGIELARELRLRWPGIAIVYVSGYPRDVVDQHGEMDGPLVEKPFSVDALQTAIAQALAAL